MIFAPLFYQTQLVGLSFICLALLYIDRLVARKTNGQRDSNEPSTDACLAMGKSNRASMDALTRKYLVVYGIVMGADWLQGPYVYSLYREQYKFPERMVALFFVTGFISAGLAAPLIGVWADHHGRRKACLVFCITYTLSCLCITLPYLPILLLGRILGGISTSILFSAFESWLISEGTSASLPSADLSTIMGRATLLNGFIATGAGVFSNQLVSMTGDFAAPFMASGALLIVAWVVIRGAWAENYGGGGQANDDTFQLERLGKAWTIVWTDPVLIVLGLAQTCFEGSMYLFVFLWVPSLQESSSAPELLPLGYIFSSFMISMMLGSLLYTSIVAYYQRRPRQPSFSHSSGVTLHAQLSSIVCALSALSLGTSVLSPNEHTRFWAFCVFEACVGMYFPVQGTLRAALITNEHRATLSSLFRVPLNVFVVVSLLMGVSSARRAVLTASAVMLTGSSLMTAIVIGGQGKTEPAHRTTRG